jgi:hypothetical protein
LEKRYQERHQAANPNHHQQRAERDDQDRDREGEEKKIQIQKAVRKMIKREVNAQNEKVKDSFNTGQEDIKRKEESQITNARRRSIGSGSGRRTRSRQSPGAGQR